MISPQKAWGICADDAIAALARNIPGRDAHAAYSVNPLFMSGVYLGLPIAN
jgi:hypothetical protein